MSASAMTARHSHRHREGPVGLGGGEVAAVLFSRLEAPARKNEPGRELIHHHDGETANRRALSIAAAPVSPSPGRAQSGQPVMGARPFGLRSAKAKGLRPDPATGQFRRLLFVFSSQFAHEFWQTAGELQV